MKYHVDEAKTPTVQKRKLKWTVEFHVDPLWVADGFDLTNERALNMLGTDLGWANMSYELGAKVIAKPDPRIIKGLQDGSIGFPGDDYGN